MSVIRKHGDRVTKQTYRLGLRERISLVRSVEDSSGIIYEVRTILLEVN